MFKVYSRKTASAILASSLLFGIGTVAIAAPNSNSNVTTGRTEQNVATGAIFADQVPTLAHRATDVTLTGKVVIDGPQLVLKVNGQDVTKQAIITKVADKTWTYQYKTTVGDQTGDVSFEIGAYTIYANGKPAGQTHTTAKSATQTVHVPFIKSYDYTNLKFTDYDRYNNNFSFTYNLVNVWDDGVHEVEENLVEANVEGTETYQHKGFTIVPPIAVREYNASEGIFTDYNHSDNTFTLTFTLTKSLSKGEPESDQVIRRVDASKPFSYTASDDRAFGYTEEYSFNPPIVLRDFTFSSKLPVWKYDEGSKTYSVSFDIDKTFSNHETSSETITRDGLTPGSVTEVSVTREGITRSTNLTVPASPEPAIPSSVTGTVDVSSIKSVWLGSSGNVKSTYTLTYTINGTSFEKSLEFVFNSGKNFVDQNLTEEVTYKDKTVIVNYTLPYKKPA